MDPKISIIIPVYNSENTLQRCLDSVLAQTFTDFECLLINDGSKDRSGDICDEYARKDSRVKVFHKENGGVSSARNVGLENAIGEWVTFCDSDDDVTATWLENYLPISSDSVLVVQGLKLIDNNVFRLCKGIPNRYSISEGLHELDSFKSVGYTPVKIFNMSIINKYNIRFDTEYKYREDELFVLQYSVFCETMEIKDVVNYNYYVPNWAVKYNEHLPYSQYEKMWDAVCAIENGRNTYFLQEYLSSIIYGALWDNDVVSEMRARILSVRKKVGILLLKSKSVLPLRVIWLIDCTGVFSTIFAYIYKLVKRCYVRDQVLLIH